MSRLLFTSQKRITQTIAIVWLITVGTIAAQAQSQALPPAYYPPSAQQPVATPPQPKVTAPIFSLQPTSTPRRANTKRIPEQVEAPAQQPPARPTIRLAAPKLAAPNLAAPKHVSVAPENAPLLTVPAVTVPVETAPVETVAPESTIAHTSAIVPLPDSMFQTRPIGVVPTLARTELLEPITPTAPNTTSQIQRRKIERLPATRTALTTGPDISSPSSNGQAFGLELSAPIQNQFDMLPPPEFQSPGNVYRIAEATTATDSTKKPTAPAASQPEKPTPTPSSQPTVAGGHGGHGAGYGGQGGCGPGCGGCAQCNSPFSPDPNYDNVKFDPEWEWDVYAGKWWNCVQQPWISWGRGLYGPGPTPPSKDWFGRKNPINTSFLLYGDYRTALAYNDNGAKDKTVWAHRLNLDFDFKWTSTERLHAFWGPLDKGNNFTRFEADDDELKFNSEFDENFDTLFFEGDLGYIWGGFTDQYAPFDLPVALGRFPLFFQNGIWFNEVIEGFAFTIPARHFRVPTVSNWELTWFFGFDDVANPAFANDDDVANIYGMHGFWELQEGYLETGYAFLDDQTGAGLGFHSFGFSWSRRYFHRVSNAVRLMLSSGQAPNSGGRDTADGQLLLIENSWISNNPNYFVPYFNLFAGFGAPQSAARAADNILVNTGINFESDALTGYPTLDASGKDAWGGALGVNLLGPDFSWQWIVEFAWLQTFGDPANRQAVADQYAIGTRYQIPLNYAWILRMDAMHGFLEEDDDLTGARVELRWKF